MGAVQILTPLDGAVDRGELGAQGLRPARLRARRRGRRWARCSRRTSRSRSAPPRSLVPPVPRDHLGDRPARHRHGLRVRHDDVPAALALDAEELEARFVELEEQALRSCRRTASLQIGVSSSASRTAGTSARATSCASTSGRDVNDDGWAETVAARFHDAHEREYSRRFEDSDIEIPNVRVRGIGLIPPFELPEAEKGDESPEARCVTSATPGSPSGASCARSRRATTPGRL